MGYNVTFLNTGTGMMSVVEGVNDMTGGLYVTLMITAIFFVMFLAMKSKGFDTAATFLTSSFVVSIISVVLFAAGLIGVEILAVPLVLLLVAIFIQAASQ